MFCPKCGKPVADGARFCPSCGNRLPEPAGPTVSPGPQVMGAEGDVGAGTAAPSAGPASPEPAASAAAAPSSPESTPVAPAPPTAGAAPAGAPAGNPSATAAPPMGSAPAQGAAAPAQPASAAGPRRSRSKLPILIAAVVAVAVVAVAAFALPRLLGGRTQEDQAAANSAANRGTVSSAADGYDFFYSTEVGGICRADPGSGEVELIYPVDSTTYQVGAMAVDGDRLFFSYGSYMDGSLPHEIHSIATDGTDDRTLVSDRFGCPDGSYLNVGQIVIYDDTLYVVASASGEGGRRTTVTTMAEDGSACTLRCSIDRPVGSSFLVMPDSAYYADTTAGTIVRYRFDGGQTETVYTGSLGSFIGLSSSGDRLVVLENGGGRFTVTSIAPDGSDARTVYEAAPSTGCRLLATSGDSVYLESYETAPDMVDITVWDLLRVPLDGGEPQTLAEDLDVYNPTVSVLGDRLLILENGQYAGSAGGRAVSIGLDGSNMIEYQIQ